MNNFAENEPITSVDLFITEKCNLVCKYCFHKQTDATLTLEQGKLILDKLYETNPTNFLITFFGGEPMLYPQLVLDLALYARQLWKPTVINGIPVENVGFSISTNGTIFNEDIFKQFKDLHFHVQVSLDGDKDTTELNRKGIDFEGLINNIKAMLKIDPNITVRMTYTPDTVGMLAQNVEFIYNLGVKYIMHHAVMEANWTEQTIMQYGYQLKQVYNLRRFLKKQGRKIDIVFIDKNLKLLNDDMKYESRYCGAGKDYIAILPNGDIYPCHRAASNRLFKLGNILDTSFPIIRGMFLTINKDRTGCSSNCQAFKTCHTCLITHYLINQDISKPIEKYCSICKIEDQFAKDYLQIELNDRYDKKLESVGSLLADLVEQNEEFKNKTLELIEKVFLLSKSEKEDAGSK